MPTNREIPHHRRAPISASEVDGHALEKQLARLSMLAHLERIQMELELSRVPYSPPTPTPIGHGAACATAAGPASAAGRGKQRPRGLPTRIPPGVTEPKKTANWGQIAVLLDCITDLHDESRLPSPAPGTASPPPPPTPRTGTDRSGAGDGYATGDSGESGGEQHAADDDVHIWAGASESPSFRARLDELKARRGCWDEYDDGDDGDDEVGDEDGANDNDNDDDADADAEAEADADYNALDEGGSLLFAITASGQSPPPLPGGARDRGVGMEESRRGNAAVGAHPTAASGSGNSSGLTVDGRSKGKGLAATGRPIAVSLPATLPSRAPAAPGGPETAAVLTVRPFEEERATGGVQNALSHDAAAPPSRGCSDANSSSRSGAASRLGSSEKNNSRKLARSQRSGTASGSSSSIRNSSGQLIPDSRSHHSEATPPVPTEREGSNASPRLSAAILPLEGLRGYSASNSRGSSQSGRRRSELLYELPVSATPTGSPQPSLYVCSGAAGGCAGTRSSLPRPCSATGPHNRRQQEQQQEQQEQQETEQEQEQEQDEAEDIWQDARVGELVWDERELRFRFPHLELGGSPTANAGCHWHRDGRAMAGAHGPCPHTSQPALLLGHCHANRGHTPSPARAPATDSSPQSSCTAINSAFARQGPPLLDPVVPQLLPGNTPRPAGRSKPTPTKLVPPRRALFVDGGDDEGGGGGEGGGGSGGGSGDGGGDEGGGQDASESGESDDLGQRVYFNPLFGQWLPFPTVVPEEEEQAVPGLRARIRGKVLQLADRLRRPCALCCMKRRPPIRKRHISQPTEPRRPIYEPIVL